jgi:hypothetical protein
MIHLIHLLHPRVDHNTGYLFRDKMEPKPPLLWTTPYMWKTTLILAI